MAEALRDAGCVGSVDEEAGEDHRRDDRDRHHRDGHLGHHHWEDRRHRDEVRHRRHRHHRDRRQYGLEARRDVNLVARRERPDEGHHG